MPCRLCGYHWNQKEDISIMIEHGSYAGWYMLYHARCLNNEIEGRALREGYADMGSHFTWDRAVQVWRVEECPNEILTQQGPGREGWPPPCELPVEWINDSSDEAIDELVDWLTWAMTWEWKRIHEYRRFGSVKRGRVFIGATRVHS